MVINRLRAVLRRRVDPSCEQTASRGAFDSARWLLLGLALVSLLALLPDLLHRDLGTQLLGLAGAAVLAAAWLALLRGLVPAIAVDVADAGSFLLLAVAVSESWEAQGAMFGSLWYRSIGSSGRSVVLRVLLYTLVIAGTALIRVDDPTLRELLPALSVVPLWAVTAVSARRLGTMLTEHDQVAAVAAMESELGAAIVDEADEAALQAWSRASWRGLCSIVPGVRILLLERRHGVWMVVVAAGTWQHQPTSVDAAVVSTVAAWQGRGRHDGTLTPVLDAVAGGPCRWGSIPLLDRQASFRLLVGIPPTVGPGLEAAVVGAMSRSELVMQHARDHLALGVRARTDELTGLANRLAFFEALAALESTTDGLSLLFLDLDGFKAVNDTYGHVVGDEVIREAGARLGAASGAALMCARLGGDEFAVLFARASSSTANAVGRASESALLEPIETSAGPVTVGVSWGVASVPTGDTTELLARADAAMYRTKRQHRSAVGR